MLPHYINDYLDVIKIKYQLATSANIATTLATIAWIFATILER